MLVLRFYKLLQYRNYSGLSGLPVLQVQGVITARNMALPYVFWMAEWLERFHPRTALKMKLVRLFLLYLSSLYVLIIALFTLSGQCVSLLLVGEK